MRAGWEEEAPLSDRDATVAHRGEQKGRYVLSSHCHTVPLHSDTLTETFKTLDTFLIKEESFFGFNLFSCLQTLETLFKAAGSMSQTVECFLSHIYLKQDGSISTWHLLTLGQLSKNKDDWKNVVEPDWPWIWILRVKSASSVLWSKDNDQS